MAKRSLQSSAGPTAARPTLLVGAGLAVIAVTYGLARYGYGLYLPQFRAEFGFSDGTAGRLAAGGYLAYCAAALLAPPLVARGQARAALWAAGGSAALGSVVVASAPGTPVLAVGVLLAGSGAGAATPALVAAVTSTVRPPIEARAQGVVNSGTGAGVVAGGLLVLAAPAAWRAAWSGFAVLALLVTWVADRSARWPPATGGPPCPPGRPWDGLGRATAAAVLAGAGCAGVWTFGRDLLTGDGGLAPGTSGLLWCVLGAAGLAGGVSGALVERLGLRGAWRSSVLVAAAATALSAVRPDVPWLAGVALAAFGGSFVALSGVLIAWGARCRPDGAAAAAAFLFVGLTAGQALGAVGSGALAARLGLPAALLVAAGTVLLAAGVAAPPSGHGPTGRPSRTTTPAEPAPCR
jgi:predicted MFS family arabinose efflux permease